MLGRQDDVINIGGYKVAPTEVEDVALSLPDIKECICIAAEHPVIGVVTKLLIVSEKDEIDKKSIARFIASKLESYKVPIYYEKVDKIERTFNGKLNRKYYR
jgi:acyl-coenzyme A synthetase/AMP-(fatty) acid ligase